MSLFPGINKSVENNLKNRIKDRKSVTMAPGFSRKRKCKTTLFCNKRGCICREKWEINIQTSTTNTTHINKSGYNTGSVLATYVLSVHCRKGSKNSLHSYHDSSIVLFRCTKWLTWSPHSLITGMLISSIYTLIFFPAAGP